jgi:hypothetical protein
MSWVNDLASAFGLPAGAAAIAGAMYAACVAAEKNARPEALADIGRILRDPAWERSAQPSAIIERVFKWTFGDRHASWRCVTRSMCATIIFVAAFIIMLFFTEGRYPFDKARNSQVIIVQGTFEVIFAGFLPDYVALWKTRLLLTVLTRRYLGALSVSLIDISSSILIAILFYIIFVISFASPVVAVRPLLWLISPKPDNYSSLTPLLLSTLLTAIWTVLLLLSTTVLKLLAPVRRFTAWFFDVENHPVQAIGIVAGALVMIGSLAWSLIVLVI